MKKNEEMVSLNFVHIEQTKEMTLDERLERIMMDDLKKLKAGADACSTDCPTKCSNCRQEYCSECELYCGCDGWADSCPSDYCPDEYCLTMGNLT